MGTGQNKHSNADRDNKRNSIIQNAVLNNSNGVNIVSQTGNIYIGNIYINTSFLEIEGKKMKALLGESNNNHVRELEEENKRLSEDKKRLTDMVLKLQRQLIEYLSPGN